MIFRTEALYGSAPAKSYYFIEGLFCWLAADKASNFLHSSAPRSLMEFLLGPSAADRQRREIAVSTVRSWGRRGHPNYGYLTS